MGLSSGFSPLTGCTTMGKSANSELPCHRRKMKILNTIIRRIDLIYKKCSEKCVVNATQIVAIRRTKLNGFYIQVKKKL